VGKPSACSIRTEIASPTAVNSTIAANKDITKITTVHTPQRFLALCPLVALRTLLPIFARRSKGELRFKSVKPRCKFCFDLFHELVKGRRALRRCLLQSFSISHGYLNTVAAR
jgi:hypothetical protein